MLNEITIMGRLVRDPEARQVQSGVSCCAFCVAVDRDFQKDGAEKQTDFIDCVAWRSTADFVQRYVEKGSMIVVSGRLESSKWTDKEGNKRVSWQVTAANVHFGESRRDRTPSVFAGDFQDLGADDGDIPF